MNLSEIEKRLEARGIDWKSSFERLKMSLSGMSSHQLKEFVKQLEKENDSSKPL